MSQPSEVRASLSHESSAICQRVQRESRLISRLMSADLPALRQQCAELTMPHEGRSVAELRAALFNRLRRDAEH